MEQEATIPATSWWFLLEEETIKLLKLYEECKTIEKFHTIKNEIGHGVEITISITLSGRTLLFDIFWAKRNDESFIDALRNPTGYEILVREHTTAEELCWEFLSKFNEREEEYQKEMAYINIIKDHYPAEHATYEEDTLHGIDVKVHGSNGIMPLQLKSSAYMQRIHKNEYPGIPSLVFSPTLSKDKILSATKMLYRAYFKKDVLHLNLLNGTPYG